MTSFLPALASEKIWREKRFGGRVLRIRLDRSTALTRGTYLAGEAE
jgi:hypothetical protein